MDLEFPNFLQALKYYIQLKRNKEDKKAFIELCKIEGPRFAKVILDQLYSGKECGQLVKWHPGQAHWVYKNVSELRMILEEELAYSEINLEHFRPIECTTDKETIKSIVDEDSSNEEYWLSLIPYSM